ncbi:hypothetical protein SteCoe_27277 [Stentor coeruleus]|uniref:MORN repeat protein n=1 Tax=Stentor coeruleus TaxID=5963 RepID=A0A1R2BAV9_9CILI|nr:hypothetical protein SteCoe_27277 [Stentor coeruleus]
MGSCFCCHGKNDDSEIEIFVSGQNASLKSEINLDQSLEMHIEDINSKSENSKGLYELDLDVNKEIKAQALVRGYLSRSKFKIKKNHLRYNNHIENQKNNSEEKFICNLQRGNTIRQLNEVPVDMYLSYFNSQVVSLRFKLGDFVCKKLEKFYKSVKEYRNYILMEDESIYSGEFNILNERYGYGTCIKKSGSFYEGFWERDKQNGHGRLIHGNCEVYEGGWLDNEAHGYGFYIDVNDNRYEGDWEYNKKHGNGNEILSDGTKYQGSYINGQKDGFGKLEKSDGSIYEGEFKNGQFNGNGTLTLDDWKKIGEWKDNLMNGKGKIIWNDGRIYEGDIVNNIIHGYGVFIWPDKRKYEGYWINGKKDGKGLYTTTLGLRETECKEGKMIKFISVDNKN